MYKNKTKIDETGGKQDCLPNKSGGNILSHSWFETALDYKPQILGPKIEEFHLLVHKLSVMLTGLPYKPQWKMGKKLYKPWLIIVSVRYALYE